MGRSHTLQSLLYLWQWIGVLLGACVELAKIHTEVQCSILLSHQYDNIALGGLAGMYSPCIQHISEQSAYLLQQQWKNSPEMLLKRLTVSDLDLALSHTDATQLMPIQYKNVVESQHQFSHRCSIVGESSY